MNMTWISFILCFYVAIKTNLANIKFTNSSAYFKENISTSEIILLQNNQYNGISANVTFSIEYIISNESENKLVTDLLSISLKQTLKKEISNMGDEQIILYDIKTVSQQQNIYQTSEFMCTVFAAILTYTISELQNISTFILSTNSTNSTFESELQTTLNNTFTENIKSLKSIIVNKDKTTINYVLVDTNDLYGTDNDNDNNTTEDSGEKQIMFIFIIVAIVMVILIACFAVFIMKRKFNAKNLDALEKSLLENNSQNNSQNDSQNNEYEYPTPKSYKTSVSIASTENRQIELQSKHEQQPLKSHRPKISSYDWETPGYDAKSDDSDDNAPDAMDDIDDYLAKSDDENEDMYAPSEITDETPQ